MGDTTDDDNDKRKASDLRGDTGIHVTRVTHCIARGRRPHDSVHE